MRPRKSILLACCRSSNAEELQYLLEIRGRYKVTFIAEPEDALMLLRGKSFDLLLVELAAMSAEANELVRMAKMIDRDMPAIIFSRTVNAYDLGCLADHFIPEQFCNSEEILTRVGILAKRKRGPKPKRQLVALTVTA